MVRKGKALHSIIVMYLGSIHLIWIPKLRDFRCLCFDLRKMVANAECSRQDMVLLWRKMARGKGCSPASWKIRLLFGTCCYGLGQGRLHVGVWPEDTASVSWSRVERLIHQMQKADDSVPPRDFHPLGIKGILMCSSVDKVLPLTEILVDLLVLWPSGFQCYVCKFFLKLQPQSAAHTPSTTQIAKSSLWWSAFWLDMHSGSQWQYFGQLQERRNGLDCVTVKTFRSLKVG